MNLESTIRWPVNLHSVKLKSSAGETSPTSRLTLETVPSLAQAGREINCHPGAFGDHHVVQYKVRRITCAPSAPC